LNTGATGPKVSSKASCIALLTLASTVGMKKVPPSAWAFPPVAFHSTENNNAAYSTTSWHTMKTGFAA
jgi:hypothetical protein